MWAGQEIAGRGFHVPETADEDPDRVSDLRQGRWFYNEGELHKEKQGAEESQHGEGGEGRAVLFFCLVPERNEDGSIEEILDKSAEPAIFPHAGEEVRLGIAELGAASECGLATREKIPASFIEERDDKAAGERSSEVDADIGAEASGACSKEGEADQIIKVLSDSPIVITFWRIHEGVPVAPYVRADMGGID